MFDLDPVALFEPEQSVPLLLDSPHSGTVYPPDFDHAIARAALRDAEDTHVDTLYRPCVGLGATLLAAQFPRSYIDCNRAASDIDTVLLDGPWPGPITPSRKTELGKGLVWRCLDDGTPIYQRRLQPAEVAQRIEGCWQPYWDQLQRLASALRAAHGRLYHINCHSMPSQRGLMAIDGPSTAQADFVIGDRDGSTCAPEFARFVAHFLRQRGWKVAYNDPYKGVEIIRVLGQPGKHCHSIQLEINRRLYLDESSRALLREHVALQSLLQELCAAVIVRFCKRD
jgi:N-formylglutamate amidohydrolase